MPASNAGIDLIANSEVPLNQKLHNNRIIEYGVSLFKGDTISITKVEQKENSLIIYLGAGGYNHNEHLHSTEKKQIIKVSEKENSLKKQIAEETDQSKLAKLNRDLNKLNRIRSIKQGQLDSKAAESKIIKAEKEYIEIKDSGSRIYINFQNNMEQKDFGLDAIEKILSNYVSFENSHPAKSSELIIRSDTKNN